MVSEELRDWTDASLRNIEVKLEELDSSKCGKIDQFHLTHVFLNNEPEVGSALGRSEVLRVSESTHSERPGGSADPREAEIWLQRFQRMEDAMRMCDTQNTVETEATTHVKTTMTTSIQTEVLQVLSQYPNGLKVSDFTGAYYKYYRRKLVLSEHGFKKLTGLFNDMKDKVDIEVSAGQEVVKVKPEHHSQNQAFPYNHFDRPEHSAAAFPPAYLLSQNCIPRGFAQTSNKDPNSGPGNKSYNDVLRQGIETQSRPSGSAPVSINSTRHTSKQSEPLIRLKGSLCDLMRRHPEGMPLTQVRRSCMLLHDPQLLEGFASCRQLLASLTDVVLLQGFGVQTQVLPAAALTQPQQGHALIPNTQLTQIGGEARRNH
ncbi:hypothetical protein MATL_G00026100 [Megalops atlanticus]|uniref:HTH OST-type domain-containing protein n=1 Tax=Megalops atlanticus TaxID=7932 RepID=A0A9D3TJN5_MEGAT|nr:hypothetical protein MATL_G00026100 [Megalops atlanticus]